MSNKIVNAVKKIKLGDSNAKSVLRELADCANSDGFCFPSYSTIAEVLEVSPKSIQRAMNFLISNGWVIRDEKEKTNGKFVGFTFQINLNFLGLSDIEFISNKPVDNLTNGQFDQWTECPAEKALPVDNLSAKTSKPVDNLTNGQFDHQNPNKKDLFLNPQNKEFNQKEGETRPPVRSLSVDEVLELEETVLANETEFLQNEFIPVSIQIYQDVFPNHPIDGEVLKDFTARLPEVEESVWRQTLLDWRLARYKASNIPGMISRYHKDLKDRELEQNANNNGKLSAKERREQSAINEITEIESIRTRVEQRRKAKLSGSNAAGD